VLERSRLREEAIPLVRGQRRAAASSALAEADAALPNSSEPKA
jgi:hypothetical protein